MNKHIAFLLLFIGLSQAVLSQKKVWIKFGDQSMEVHDAYSASKFYEKALVTDSTDIAVQYKLAKAFMAYQNYPNALPICLDVLKNRSTEEFKLIHFDLAKIYKHLGNFEAAIKHFERFVKRGDKSSFEYLSAKNELANFEKVTLLIQDTLKVKVNNLPGTVNTGASEFSPIMWNDSTLLFSSLRAVSVLEGGTVKDLDYTTGIYQATKTDSVWYVGSELGIKNTEKKSVANGSFNKGKTEFYFSVCENFGSCKIYQGKFNEDSIMEHTVLPAPINIPNVTSTHPFIMEIKGKKMLVFSSNRAGGKGGMDLWVSAYKGKWTTPKNLGKPVNTLGNELTPFFDSDSSRLYFSSDWHYNLGGLDIFSTQGTFPSSWDNVVNMGIPYNSPLNDLYYVHGNESEGFLTSSREGSKTEKDAPCCNDIYDFKKEQEIVTNVEELVLFSTLYRRNVKVYFHNDRPNVDSWDTLTALNYDTTYSKYVLRYQEYKKEFSAQFKNERSEGARLEIDTFFNDYLYKGHDDLIVFTEKLIEELDSGRSVEVILRGFASPLTKSNYNVNLSRRRISSIMNFLNAYRGGVLQKYMMSDGSGVAALSFVKNPNGEYKAQKGVSDDYYDVRNSIFNPKAALERKVELYANLIYQDDVPVIALFSKENVITIDTKGVELKSLKLMLHNNAKTVVGVEGLILDEKKQPFNSLILQEDELVEITILLAGDLKKTRKLVFTGGRVTKELTIILQ